MEGADDTKPNEQRDNTPAAAPPDGSFCSRLLNSLLTTSSLLYLSISVMVSAYRSRSNPSTIAFILFSYFDLLCLFSCLRSFERLGPESPPEKKVKIKAAVWLLATALILAFACRVSKVMPWGLAVVVWAMAGGVAVGGFYGLFLYQGPQQHQEDEQ